jgi:3-oxoacyl-[acyl-carrier protein] reductase
MSDVLLKIGKNNVARQMVKNLGLPVSLPQALKRAEGSWEERPLADLRVDAGHGPGSALAPVLARCLCAAGAYTHVAGTPEQFAFYTEHGHAWGRIAKEAKEDQAPEGCAPNALVFDATGMQSPADLVSMYRFFHARVRSLAACGRILVIGTTPSEIADVPASAAAQALEGFVRSVGKEIGKKGATANLVWVSPGAEDRLPPVVRFFLSRRPVFVSGQNLTLTTRVPAPENPSDVRPLDGKLALVTGAARGIGKETAKTLALEGAKVICMDRPGEEEPTALLAKEIQGTALSCDVTAPDAGEVIARHVKEHGGSLAVIIHNAGVTRDKMLVNMDEARWSSALQINLLSVLSLTDQLLPLMPKDGRIVCLSSIAGIAGNVGQTNYAASKAGIIGFVRALAPKAAEKGICVNAVAPGFIETQMTAAIPFTTREAGRRLSSLAQGGLPQDVAQVVCFLATPQASGVTGATLRICGQSLIGA